MSDLPVLRLTLERPECIRGESLPFTLELENSSQVPYEQCYTFAPENEATTLTAVRASDAPGGGQAGKPIVGCAMSPIHRDGVHMHGPDEPDRTTLRPGQVLRTRGDILAWLGELEPGVYTLAARHRGILEPLESAPVQLTVRPARPVLLSTPRYGLQAPNTPRAAAWAHDTGSGLQIFMQRQSDRLPRNPLRGLRAGSTAQTDAIVASTYPAEMMPFEHALWQERGRLSIATVDTSGKTPVQTAQVRAAPRGAVLLRSPLSLPDGTCWAVLAQEGDKSITLLRIKPDGDAVSFDIGLGKPVSTTAYTVCWDLLTRLHFAWAAPGGRDISVATIPLDDPAAGAPVRSAYFADAPAIWIDMYLDPRQMMGGPPMFEHQVPPGEEPKVEPGAAAEYLWTVTRRDQQLTCTRGLVGARLHRPEAVFDITDAPEARVIASTLMLDNKLCLIVRDAAGRLFYASTHTGEFRPLTDELGRPITEAQHPGLMAGSERATLPWVHVRYIDAGGGGAGGGGRIGWHKLEPADEPEPVHGHHDD